MKNLSLLSIVFVVSFVISGCCSVAKCPVENCPEDAKVDVANVGAAGVLDGKWLLCDASFYSGDMATVPKGVSLSFNDKSCSGFSGLNSFFGKSEITEDGKANIKPGGSSLRAGSPDAMKFEKEFFKMLGKVNRFERDKNILTLFNNNDILAVFKAEKL